jgi:hypothetical protein
MEVSGQLYAPATLCPRKEYPVPIEQKAVWIPELSKDKVAKRKVLLGINPWSFSWMPVTLLTELIA